MRVKTTWLLALLCVGALAFQAAPAQAQFPERHSYEMYDVAGFLIDCLDVGRCNAASCPATLYLSNRRGHCTPFVQFETGRYRSTCTFTNFDFSFFAPNTRRMDLDLTCSRWGTPWYWFGFATPPAGSCAMESTQRRIDQYGLNFTKNESYTAATYTRPLTCEDGFATMSVEDLENFDGQRRLRRRPR